MKSAEIRELIQRGSNKLNKFFYVAVVIGIVLGPGVLLAYFIPSVRNSMDAENARYLLYLGIGATVLFAGVLIEQWNKHRKDNIILQQIKSGMKQVAWVYKEVSGGAVRTTSAGPTNQVAQFTHVYFNLLDGSNTFVWLNSADADRLIELLKESYPDISYGYTQELEQSYRQQPIALKNSPLQVSDVKRSNVRVRV